MLDLLASFLTTLGSVGLGRVHASAGCIDDSETIVVWDRGTSCSKRSSRAKPIECKEACVRAVIHWVKVVVMVVYESD